MSIGLDLMPKIKLIRKFNIRKMRLQDWFSYILCWFFNKFNNSVNDDFSCYLGDGGLDDVVPAFANNISVRAGGHDSSLAELTDD